MEAYLEDNKNFPLIIDFRLRSYTLSSGHYLTLDLGNFTVDTAANIADVSRVLWRYKRTSWAYWVPIDDA